MRSASSTPKPKPLAAAHRKELDFLRRFTRGTCGYRYAVPADQLEGARAYLRGKKWGALVELDAEPGP